MFVLTEVVMVPIVYIWADSLLLSCGGLSDLTGQTLSQHALVVVAEGEGILRANGRSYALKPGLCLAFDPDTDLHISNRSAGWLQAFLIRYVPVQVPSAAPPGAPGATGFQAGEVISSSAKAVQLAQSLYDSREIDRELQEYSNHALFQELILILMKAQAGGKEQQSIQAVERSISQMEESSTLDYTLGQLAEMAGLSARHYSRIFRKLTGQSPIDYLIGLRMKRAKELLAVSDHAVHAVASHLGFRDPFHFSRTFKQQTGASPRLYAQLQKERTRLTSLQFLGEMLALGIKPVGAPTQLLRGRYLSSHAAGIEEIAETVVTPYMDRLADLKPDAIVTFNGYHLSEYTKIAPTLDIPWKMPFFERFTLIADLLGKKTAAEAWIHSYQGETEETKAQLSRYMSPEQTVSFFWMRGLPATFQVYFDVGVLYRDLGFQAPPAVTAVQNQKEHPFKRDIPLSELARYAGDYLFVVVSLDAHSQAQFAALSASPQWQQLKAVRSGKVYLLTEDWLREDPLSMLGQVRDALRLLHA
ncbi:helix-turn-helix domain-containing protein [Paenibacillus filicis]|uniref:Helix-turn-helix domain-containing protein n=1 Tax=Paenibacillus filicis TaxID=669464 RepID=A0ABU9DCE0_9BACL